jgi:hypothetical protein
MCCLAYQDIDEKNRLSLGWIDLLPLAFFGAIFHGQS